LLEKKIGTAMKMAQARRPGDCLLFWSKGDIGELVLVRDRERLEKKQGRNPEDSALPVAF
jgi:hypothetical protein